MSMLLGLTGIIGTIWFVMVHPHASFSGFWDPSGAMLLGLGPPCIMLLSHTVGDLFMGIKLLLQSITSQHNRNQAEIIDTLTKASQIVRSEGLGALVPLRDRAGYALLKDGLSLIINDFKSEEIRHNLMARVNAKQLRMALATNLFENMSKLCPGVGMIGTLLGLIHMLSQMNDPAKLGGGMAMAMITTLYGLSIGTVIYGPWGEKIHLESEKVQELDMMIVEGMLNIKGKKSSVHMKDIMKTYATTKQGQQPKGA
ncbi:MAG: MotA/TolQ/ExbB proton channel family protein [Proteobacteria bacterium]|nr:MotA/TolQ/ExbB proton channel family protein [Pseudomonadota bacterium]